MVDPCVYLLDELGGHADGLRAAAMDATYSRVSVELPDGRSAEGDLVASAPARASRRLVRSIGKRLGVPAQLLAASFRFGSAGDGQGWRVVGGGGPMVADGTHVAIMGLPGDEARARPLGDGLALWRHAASGAVGGDELPLLDRFNLDAWVMSGLVPLIDNRVAVVPVAAFMSVWPMASLGTGFAGGRLLWAAHVEL